MSTEGVVTSATGFSAVKATWSSRAKPVSASKDCISKVRMLCKVVTRIVSVASFL